MFISMRWNKGIGLFSVVGCVHIVFDNRDVLNTFDENYSVSILNQ